MRYDSIRIKCNIQATLFYKTQIYPIYVISISNYGCRLILKEPYFQLGSIVDLKLENGLFFTGVILNKEAFEYGLSILAISKNSLDILMNMIENNMFNVPYSKFELSSSHRKILVLGAGGGKIFSQLELLSLIEKEYDMPIQLIFDCFGGVSSGAVLATLLGMGLSIKSIKEILVENYNTLFSFHFELNKSILDIKPLFKKISNIMNEIKFQELEKEIFIFTRNFSTGIFQYYSNITEEEFIVERAVKESMSIPIIFGAYEDMIDGAVGIFTNPSEIIFRFYRTLGIKMDKISAIYLDAGFDPVHRYKSEDKNIFTQLKWVLENTLRDSILSSFERIEHQFPDINYFPYLFTFSKSYDLLAKEDAFEALKEINLKEKEFGKFLKEIKSLYK